MLINIPLLVLISINQRLPLGSIATKSKVPQNPLSEYKIFSDSANLSLCFFQNFLNLSKQDLTTGSLGSVNFSPLSHISQNL